MGGGHYLGGFCSDPLSVIASLRSRRGNPYSRAHSRTTMDCFVASLLAMTDETDRGSEQYLVAGQGSTRFEQVRGVVGE
jgi:hypothetical protein